MARGKSLLAILQDYRHEIRASSNPAHNRGARERQVHALRKTQEMLWEAHDWRHLEVERFIDVQAGQRFYGVSELIEEDGTAAADLSIDRILKIDFRYGDEWLPLCPEITDAQYNLWDSYTDQRSWPVVSWQIHEDEEIEIWPVPSTDASRYLDADSTSLEGRLRITGIRNLTDFVDDDDTADLDDRLIVLTAAAEELAEKRPTEASMLARQATRRLNTLRGNFSKKRTWGAFGAGKDTGRAHRPYIPTVHYRDRETS